MLVGTHRDDPVLLLYLLFLSLSCWSLPSSLFIPLSLPISPSLIPPSPPTPLFLSEHRNSPLCCFLLICVPQRRCSALSQITSDHLPAPSLLPGAFSPSACCWAVPEVLLLHRPPAAAAAADHVWVSAWNIQSHLDPFLQCRSGWVSVFWCVWSHITSWLFPYSWSHKLRIRTWASYTWG